MSSVFLGSGLTVVSAIENKVRGLFPLRPRLENGGRRRRAGQR
jgi:hypothetical protein